MSLKQANKQPREVTLGRVALKVYKRLTPMGNAVFRVENHSTGGLTFRSDETDDMDAANKLAW